MDFSDYDEFLTYHSNPEYRDSDYDGIRTGFEQGKKPTDLIVSESPGSQCERLCHNGDPFDFTMLHNRDADQDMNVVG